MSEPVGRVQGPARPRVAFVIQRYGVQVNGGAEAHCRLVAERMVRHWDVEVLTTCALDYVTWANHFPAGCESVAGVTVRRFPVARQRDVAEFDRLSGDLIAHRGADLAAQEEWMRAQGPWAPQLTDFIAAHRDDYELFFFFGYLYAQTYFGLPPVADKAILAPLAHDEWPIHFPMWDRIFAAPRFFMFNSIEERQFLQHRFARAALPGEIAGVGIEPPADVDGERFRAQFGVDNDFLVYVGRIDPMKGCAELFDAFVRHLAATEDRRSLMLLGRAVMPIPSHPRIRPLGFVDERTKWDALAASDALLMPSQFESLSMVVLEAWAMARPVVANGMSDVLNGQVQRAGGGITYRSPAEFSDALQRLSEPSTRAALGASGRAFVRSTYSWERVEQHYLHAAAQVIDGDTAGTRAPSPPPPAANAAPTTDPHMNPTEHTAQVPIGDRVYTMVSDDSYLEHVSGGFEPEMVKLFQDLVGRDDYVLDVGANIGCTTVLFGELAAHVDAFEPSGSTFSFLARNVTASGHRNIDLHNMALGADERESILTFSPADRSGGFVSGDLKVSAGHVTEKIVVRPLDGFMRAQSRPRIDFVKIDVEGFEQSVLAGGRQTLARFRPVVVMELNHWCLALQRNNVLDYFDFLRSLFPVLLAVDGRHFDDLHDDGARYHVMYHHINSKRYNNLIGAFDRTRVARLAAPA